MDSELKMVWAYIRAVFGHWWVITIEVVLVGLDLVERAFGTWLLPPRWAKVSIGAAVLVLAQYFAYRDQQKLLRGAEAGKLTAEAAASSANAIMNAERAWIVANPTEWNPRLQVISLEEAGLAKNNYFGITFKNVGKTPARLVETSMKYIVVDGPLNSLPQEPSYGAGSSHDGMLLAPHDEASQDFFGAVAFLEPSPLLFKDKYEKLMDHRAFVRRQLFFPLNDN